MQKVKLGIIGLGCRGYGLIETIMSTKKADIVAVSDLYKDRIDAAVQKVVSLGGKKPVGYSDYHDLISDKNVACVFIAASWDEHIRMALESMEEKKITALEVGGVYDVAECWKLVDTYERTKTPLMMMENCCYGQFELLSENLVRAGRLGTVVHCHGAYGHDLRDEILGGNVNRHYRLNNYIKRNCENYPTHELGPIARILGINRGNRMLSLVSVASKAAGLEEFSRTDKNPDRSLAGQRFAQGDIVNTLITCAGGETISLKLDTTLPRYYSREFTVRGTKGLCNGEANMIFLEEDVNEHEFFDPHLTLKKHMDNLGRYAEYMPEMWKKITPEEMEAGHGGMDYLMFNSFFDIVLSGRELPIDVYDTAAWMCISALSAQSIANGGRPEPIPDFTCGKWMLRKPNFLE